jgi:murein DD-endopeptidase MepM/ murein hydrolase activator NlpD
MAHFDFTLQNFKDGQSVAEAFIGSAKNYDPSGIAKPLKTSASMEDGKKSLTTWNISDILQNNISFKPEGLAYTQFNEQLSASARSSYSIRLNNKLIESPGGKYLAGFDVMGTRNQIIDLTVSGISATGTQSSATTSSGRPAPPSSGFILSGEYRFPTHKTHYSDPGSGTKAMDIGHSMGSPVFSPWDGQVAYIGYADGFEPKSGATKDSSGGNAIVIVGDNGWSIYMCHFQNQPIVNKGDRVSRGQNVAHVGSTGRSSGPHVHVSVAQSTNYADVWNNPIDYLWDFMKDLENQANQVASQVRDVETGGLGLRL